MSSPSPPVRIRFGAFEVDLRSGELRKYGVKIKLHGQPFQILSMLLERPGEVVTREQLRQKLWHGDTFVDFDLGLNSAVKKLREALGDSAESPRFVETLPRRGYRLMATAGEVVAETGDGQVSTSVVRDGPGMGGLPSPARNKTGRNRIMGVPRALALAGVLGAVALSLLLAGNVAGLRNRLLKRSEVKQFRTLAVLPFANLSGDSSQDYFADGMTEELITDLGRIEGLRVISRTSAMHYKDTHKTLPEIARELHVEAVVEGAVVRSGNRVRITAQLVEASSDQHLWAQNYERDLQETLTLQDEVARDIANQVRIELSPQEQTRLSGARPVNPSAQEAYLRGRYEWNHWTQASLEKSIEQFEQATQKDPAYAQAWAGLSDAYSLLGVLGLWPRQVALEKADAAALKAIELDEGLSEAHVSLASVMVPLAWSRSAGEQERRQAWSASEKEFRRAIALNPNNAVAHQWYGYRLTAMGRLEEAIVEMERARQLDPISPNTQNSLGVALYRAGHYDEALQQFREVPDPDANSERRHRRIATIYERMGRQKEAIAELLTVMRLTGKKELALLVEQKYVSSGYPEAKKTFLRGDIQDKRQGYAKKDHPSGLAFDIADDYAALGQRDKAFEWLDQAFRELDLGLIYLKSDDNFEALQSDPRFQKFLHRIGLS